MNHHLNHVNEYLHLASYALDFVVEPIRDADGIVTGIFLEGYDVSERNRAEAALLEESRTLDTLEAR